jgi:hypothetical protein
VCCRDPGSGHKPLRTAKDMEVSRKRNPHLRMGFGELPAKTAPVHRERMPSSRRSNSPDRYDGQAVTNDNLDLRAVMIRFRQLRTPLSVAVLIFTACSGAPRAGSMGPTAFIDESLPLTRAERSGYLETTRYHEVMEFMEAVADRSPDLHLTTFGYSYEGRALPLMVWGAPDATPEGVARTGKTRIYLQANIHAGEVEGKEALLVLLREISNGRHSAWADSLVLLVAPIYNADGNERVNLSNRPHQHGPLAGMGQRPNAQGYDLNRDHTKLDTPEAHALLALLNRYDPHVGVDLHATNGTYHGYHLTYSPPLNPNTHPAILSGLRELWLPEMRRAMREVHGFETYYYGNVPRSESMWAAPPGSELGWYTFDHRPRFNNNYLGLRNRFAILSEAYAYLTFEERIEVTGVFVREILGHAAKNASWIRSITEAADRASIIGQQLAVRSVFERSAVPVDILMGEVSEERNPFSGAVILRRVDSVRVQPMPEFGTFAPAELERAPAAYLVPAGLSEVIAKLNAHGVVMEQLPTERTLPVERFRITRSTQSDQPFQQHRERTLTGAYESITTTVPAATMIVPMDQPLARLIFYLLEPRSDDGFVNWNVLDAALQGADHYPVLRTHAR